jgi:hypothetical protein
MAIDDIIFFGVLLFMVSGVTTFAVHRIEELRFEGVCGDLQSGSIASSRFERLAGCVVADASVDDATSIVTP